MSSSASNTPISPCSHMSAFQVTEFKGVPIYWCPVCRDHIMKGAIKHGA